MKQHGLSIGVASVALIAGSAVWAFSPQRQPAGTAQPAAAGHDDDEQEIKLADAPAAVQAAVAKLTAPANVKKIIKETDEGITTYEAEYAEGGIAGSAVFSATGDLMELERATAADKIPPALLAAIKKKYPNATLSNPQTVTKTYYEVDLVIDGKKHEIKGDASGELDDEDDEADEAEDAKAPAKDTGKH